MKNIIGKIKALSLFRKILFIYIFVWIIGGLFFTKYLWNRLYVFQINYESAKAAANPDLLMDEYTKLFQSKKIPDMVKGEWDAISPYETQDNINKFINSHVNDEKLSWKRRDDYTDLRPKYDIYSNGNYIGAIALKQKSAVDEYGFHLCEIDHSEIAFVPENLKQIEITAYDGTSVYINDKLLSDRFIEQKPLDNAMDMEASEESGKEIKVNTFVLTGFFQYPDVRIEKRGYICDMDMEESDDGRCIYSQLTMYDPEKLAEISDRALEIAKAYDLYAAGIREIGGMGSYFMYSGRGYRMLSGLAFDISIAGTTTVYDILEAETGNLHVYSDEDAVIDTYQSIHRVHRNIEYNEKINIRWYLKKVNGRWMVKDFSMRV